MATVTLTSIDRHGRLVLVPSKVAPEDLFRHQRRCVAGAELRPAVLSVRGRRAAAARLISPPGAGGAGTVLRGSWRSRAQGVFERPDGPRYHDIKGHMGFARLFEPPLDGLAGHGPSEGRD
jgi:hypothetical protein